LKIFLYGVLKIPSARSVRLQAIVRLRVPGAPSGACTQRTHREFCITQSGDSSTPWVYWGKKQSNVPALKWHVVIHDIQVADV
jgi:hypothetical protein